VRQVSPEYNSFGNDLSRGLPEIDTDDFLFAYALGADTSGIEWIAEMQLEYFEKQDLKVLQASMNGIDSVKFIEERN
jgi:hypothetical protein